MLWGSVQHSLKKVKIRYTRLPPDEILTTRGSIEGERKLLAVLFAKVANDASIAEKPDPEEVQQFMDGYFKILMDEIHR